MKYMTSILLAKYSIQFRVFLGNALYILGFIFVYFGIKSVILTLVLIGGIFFGMGAAAVFLGIACFMKYLPTKYFMMFFIGNRFGGFLITILFLVLEFNGLSIQNVFY